MTVLKVLRQAEELAKTASSSSSSSSSFSGPAVAAPPAVVDSAPQAKAPALPVVQQSRQNQSRAPPARPLHGGTRDLAAGCAARQASALLGKSMVQRVLTCVICASALLPFQNARFWFRLVRVQRHLSTCSTDEVSPSQRGSERQFQLLLVTNGE